MMIVDHYTEAGSILDFNIEDTPRQTIGFYWLKIITDGLGTPVSIPIMVARGIKDHPVVGVTAAVHGNELNGIPVIQKLFREIDVTELEGVVVAVPVVNLPSFNTKKRRFTDGVDLNKIFPGREDGAVSEVYAHRFIEAVVKKFTYLFDLHTASSGRINSFYIRANMSVPVTRELARLQNASIVVHNPASDGTLRGAASAMKIPSITLELGNPNTFQKKLIERGHTGIMNVLSYFNMIPQPVITPDTKSIICEKSYWIYTDRGGLLTVHSDLTEMVKEGEVIATLRDIFGKKIKEYTAPEAGVVIGKSVSPVNLTGGRILHLGIPEK